MKPVFYNNIEYQEILKKIKELMQKLEESESKESQELSTELVQYIEIMHREPLSRLIKMVESSHPELIDTFKQDFTIKTLLDLYDFNNSEIKRETTS
tara:strand:+ start:1050 stop:1340 length:291 start_codon:yes stop_codon:yes gene_type:complete